MLDEVKPEIDVQCTLAWQHMIAHNSRLQSCNVLYAPRLSSCSGSPLCDIAQQGQGVHLEGGICAFGLTGSAISILTAFAGGTACSTLDPVQHSSTLALSIQQRLGSVVAEAHVK